MVILTVFIPLFSTILCSIFSVSLGAAGSVMLVISSLFFGMAVSGYLVKSVICDNLIFEYKVYQWLDLGSTSIDVGFIFDSASVPMLGTVYLISTLVHIYSHYYMYNDPFIIRFWSYLSLFTFCMLFLLTADNLVQFFFGWEGVGFCSYLLINFWFTRPQANKAALKAVLYNRIGDFGLLFAILLVLVMFETTNFYSLFEVLIKYTDSSFFIFNQEVDVLLLICIGFFIGVMAKSAQFGLHGWLPDAMEGPTPVSALIHAATMVTAGIFLFFRVSFFFNFCGSSVLNLVVLIGGITAFFGAIVALYQYDIKKIIAYSTCSQLGYMVIACGLSETGLSLFHMINHAFFKALLFLGAGVVIHFSFGEQDLRKLGGLGNIFPLGFISTIIASLSLSGLPFLAGFYSKDAILGLLVLNNNFISKLTYVLAIFAAFCTAIYSMRIVYGVYVSTPRGSVTQYINLHPLEFAAALPLFVLSFFSIFSGLFLKDYFIGIGSEFSITGSDYFNANINFFDKIEWMPFIFKFIPFFLSIVGLVYFVGLWLFNKCLALNSFFSIFFMLKPSDNQIINKLFLAFYEFKSTILILQGFADLFVLFIVHSICINTQHFFLLDKNFFDRSAVSLAYFYKNEAIIATHYVTELNWLKSTFSEFAKIFTMYFICVVAFITTYL